MNHTCFLSCGFLLLPAEANFAEDAEDVPITQWSRVFSWTRASLVATDLFAVGFSSLTLLSDQGAGNGCCHLPKGKLFAPGCEDALPTNRSQSTCLSSRVHWVNSFQVVPSSNVLPVVCMYHGLVTGDIFLLLELKTGFLHSFCLSPAIRVYTGKDSVQHQKSLWDVFLENTWWKMQDTIKKVWSPKAKPTNRFQVYSKQTLAQYMLGNLSGSISDWKLMSAGAPEVWRYATTWHLHGLLVEGGTLPGTLQRIQAAD